MMLCHVLRPECATRELTKFRNRSNFFFAFVKSIFFLHLEGKLDFTVKKEMMCRYKFMQNYTAAAISLPMQSISLQTDKGVSLRCRLFRYIET